MREEFHYLGKNYPIVIVKKRNKNTYIRIKEGTVVVTTSYLVSKRKIYDLLEESRTKIEAMIDRDERKQSQKGKFFFLGKCYQVIEDGIHDLPVIEGKVIYVSTREFLESWLKEYTKELFFRRLKMLRESMEEKIPDCNLKIIPMKSRWGVCHIKECYVTLNSELICYDIKCLDYVIIHELCHFLEANHSKNFWRYVSKYCPDYKKIRLMLRS